LFNCAADAIFVIDSDGIILETNRFAYEHFGYAREELIGSKITEYFSEQSQYTCECNFPKLKRTGYNRADVEFVSKDGRILDMECMATAVPGRDGTFTSFLVIQRDVTDKRQAEEELQLRQVELTHVMRLSTMGEMASGMAHELNQPLAALVSYCGTASSILDSGNADLHKLRDILDRSKAEAYRAADIIRYLRQFVRKETSEKQAVTPHELFEEVLVLLKTELRRQCVSIAQDIGCGECRALVNKTEIEQVLINLIRNSVDAINEAGIADGRVLLQAHLAPNETIAITVSDNGPGIDPAILGKLFQPFQSTKDSGMGLGLSISRSIIRAQGGEMWVDTERPAGVLFGLNLPLHVH
jgi:PAS domain S-box-containing protein